VKRITVLNSDTLNADATEKFCHSLTQSLVHDASIPGCTTCNDMMCNAHSDQIIIYYNDIVNACVKAMA